MRVSSSVRLSRKRDGLSRFSDFLRNSKPKDLDQRLQVGLSTSPGASYRISSSVAGLIPGERTSATPRSVLQISDRHLGRYPIRRERNWRWKLWERWSCALRHGIQNSMEAILAYCPALSTEWLAGWQKGVNSDVWAQASLLKEREAWAITVTITERKK